MTNASLSRSYLKKATSRLKILPVLNGDGAYSDVVREAQEIVELALKGMLRQIGLEPPKWHDVGSLLVENQKRSSKRLEITITGHKCMKTLEIILKPVTLVKEEGNPRKTVLSYTQYQ